VTPDKIKRKAAPVHTAIFYCFMHPAVQDRDGMGQHLLPPGASMLNHNLFPRPWPVVYRNHKTKVTTLKFSVHCPLDNKTM